MKYIKKTRFCVQLIISLLFSIVIIIQLGLSKIVSDKEKSEPLLNKYMATSWLISISIIIYFIFLIFIISSMLCRSYIYYYKKTYEMIFFITYSVSKLIMCIALILLLIDIHSISDITIFVLFNLEAVYTTITLLIRYLTPDKYLPITFNSDSYLN
jgi:hypothetical protein